jgi:hypothetical protein
MNVWAIQKDTALKVLLLHLVHEYGENTFALNETDSHYQAIELCLNHDASGLAAYIYTFGQNAGRYGIDLKYPIVQHNIIGSNENLQLEQIVDIISIHFDR